MPRLFSAEATLEIHLMRTALVEGGVKFCLDFQVPRRHRAEFDSCVNKHLQRLEICVAGVGDEGHLNTEWMRDLVWNREEPSCTFVVSNEHELAFAKYFTQKGCNTLDFDYMAVSMEMRTYSSCTQ